VAGQPIRGGQTTPNGHGVASAAPDRPIWVAEATPWPLGVVWLPPMAQKKKKKNHWLLEVAGPPPMAMGWLRPPRSADLGRPKPPHGHWGWPTAQTKKKKLLAVGVAGPPPMAMGGFGHPRSADLGWLKPYPGRQGRFGHPLWACRPPGFFKNIF
jgi:hypothetical protein